MRPPQWNWKLQAQALGNTRHWGSILPLKWTCRGPLAEGVACLRYTVHGSLQSGTDKGAIMNGIARDCVAGRISGISSISQVSRKLRDVGIFRFFLFSHNLGDSPESQEFQKTSRISRK